MNPCRVSGCVKPAGSGRGMCHMHYKRWQMHGDPTRILTARAVKDPWERFHKQTKRMPNGCLEWTGTVSQRGYGQTKWNYKFYTAHRFSWELHYNPVPNGLFVCHKCDNPKCVDPHHLFLGTAKDNTQDAVSKGRNAFGERQGRAKLTWVLVEEIRNSKENPKLIAKRLGVSFSTIYRARNGTNWKSANARSVNANRRIGNI